MKVHTTTLTAHARAQFYGVPSCPCCGQRVIAPITSVLVNDEAIHHHWSCEACAFPFATVISLKSRGSRRPATPSPHAAGLPGDVALCA